MLSMSPDTDRPRVATLCTLLLSVLFPVVLPCDIPGASASRGRSCKDQSDWLVGVSGERRGCFQSRSTVAEFSGSSPASWPSRRSSSRVFAVLGCVHIEPFARLDGPVASVGQLAFEQDGVLWYDAVGQASW
jgi:hypothetical protein